MTIRYKFKALAWVAGIVLFGVTTISFFTSSFLVSANKDMYQDSTKGIESISVIQNLLNDVRNEEILAVTYAAVANMDKLAELEKDISAQKGVLLEKVSDLRIGGLAEDEVRGMINRYFEAAAITFDHAKHYVTDEASRNITENSRAPFDRLEETFSRSMDLRAKAAADQNRRAIMYATVSRLLLLLSMIAALGLILFLKAFSRSILEPIIKMSGFVRNTAKGDLNSTIQIDSRDEIGEMGCALNEMSAYLKGMAKTAEEIAEGNLRGDATPKSDKDVLGNAFRKMIAGLRSLIAEIRAGSERLAAASGQIAASADQASKTAESSASAVEEITATMREMSANMQNVAVNTQRQAASVAETSSTIEQMVTSILRVADNVKKLVAISEKSKEAVAGGSVAVDKASEGMSGINESIQKSARTITSLGGKTDDMAKIVEVIDDIAEQTNLLALNAAIEAAKAGEQGLGFAVVADEVRKLAERSARSTREIADLIRSVAKEAQSSVDHMTQSTSVVETGLHFSAEVIRALDGIKAAVADVAKYASEIGAATQEQSSGTEQIKRAVVNLNDIIHEIGTASEQQSAGAEQVVQAIERVKDMVRHNSSSAVELASSAVQLNGQAGSLQSLVARFALQGDGGENGHGRIEGSMKAYEEKGLTAALS